MREELQNQFLNGFNFKTIRFHDLDIKLMDDSHENENDPSSSNIVMGQFLKDNITRGQNILELGSGSGICGLYAAKLGANVIMTEKGTSQIHMLNENIKLNECSLSSVAIGLSPAMGLHTIPSFVNLISRPFDIIMASDLVQPYSIESILQMFSFVSAILKTQYHSNSSSHSYFLMSYNGETTTDITIRKTIEIADRFGLKSERISPNSNNNNNNNNIPPSSTFGRLWKFEPKYVY